MPEDPFPIPLPAWTPANPKRERELYMQRTPNALGVRNLNSLEARVGAIEGVALDKIEARLAVIEGRLDAIEAFLVMK